MTMAKKYSKYYLRHNKTYDEKSTWLVKLFVNFCKTYHLAKLMYLSDRTLVYNGSPFADLCKIPSNYQIMSLTTIFESFNDFYKHYYSPCESDLAYRGQLWRYYLIKNQKYIPEEYRKALSPTLLKEKMESVGYDRHWKIRTLFKKLKIPT